MTAVQVWTIIIPIIATVVIGLVAWLLKHALNNLEKTDERIEVKLDKIQSFTNVAANSIVEIQTLLTGKGYSINQKLAYTPGSPLKLTDYGDTLMKESGFYETLKTNRQFFVNAVRNTKPQTNYDIQESSIKTMQELAAQNNLFVVTLKNYAYNKGLPLEILLNSAGLVLRDEVMKDLKFTDSTLAK